MRLLKTCLISLIIFLLMMPQPALAFCGFYVAKADSSLYNKASQVIIARDGDRTILTMANDYQGDVKDFAMVVPVPVVVKAEQVNIGEAKILQRLDNFSAPRLVEYFDANPCDVHTYNEGLSSGVLQESKETSRRDSALGVTIEEKFTVGEYDILVLSAKESDGLEIWLRENGYKIPRGAKSILQPYIRQKMKFFVAKVNLKEFSRTGFESLRPLMIAYESPKFMLPIRLGMINAQNEQDLIVYLLSPQGQIELTNYRTVKVPSDVDIPEFVQKNFAEFYKTMFQQSYTKEGRNVAFLEYAWDMGSCDPCSAEPLNQEELKKAGVFWLDNRGFSNVFITRLHVRYTREKFPEDLQFQATGNRQSFQGRYVIRHPYQGEMTCQEAENYQRAVKDRQEQEAQNLARLTGWSVEKIRSQIKFIEVTPIPWWRRIWGMLTNWNL